LISYAISHAKANQKLVNSEYLHAWLTVTDTKIRRVKRAAALQNSTLVLDSCMGLVQ